MTQNIDQYIEVAEAARRMGYSEGHVCHLARTGKLGQVTRVGRSWLIPESRVREREQKIEGEAR